jgi:hypothetical protein
VTVHDECSGAGHTALIYSHSIKGSLRLNIRPLKSSPTHTVASTSRASHESRVKRRPSNWTLSRSPYDIDRCRQHHLVRGKLDTPQRVKSISWRVMSANDRRNARKGVGDENVMASRRLRNVLNPLVRVSIDGVQLTQSQ